jgi:hypothetical protein
MYPILFHTIMVTARKATEVIKGGGREGSTEKISIANGQPTLLDTRIFLSG